MREYTCADFEYILQRDRVTGDFIIAQLAVPMEGDKPVASCQPALNILDILDEIEDDPDFEDSDEDGFGIVWEETPAGSS